MAQPSSRQTLIDYCKRQLGAPVLEINVADEQIDDLLDDALQFFQERHFDGVEKTYLKYKLTQTDIDRGKGTAGITTTTGTGSNPLALEFRIHHVGSSDKVATTNFAGIQTGYPIYIHNTNIGSGVTSIDNSDTAVVGVGTTFLDNVYYISDYSITGTGNTIGIITCNVKSNSGIVGLGTTGSFENPVGNYSWGRLSSTGSLSRSNPISIGVSGNIVSGLSTYPTIQRRNVGIRSTGALPKIIIPWFYYKYLKNK